MQIDLNYTVDIAYPIKPQDLKHPLYYLDSGAHVIRVTLLRNGVPLTLTEEARCFGFFLHEATEVTDMSEGTVSDGNVLEVTIPELAYATPGVIYFTIRVTDDGATTTVLAITGNVRSTISGTVIDVAGTLLPNLEELIAAFEHLEEISDDLLSVIDSAAIRYDQAQTLTDVQKAQARGNIGVMTGATVLAYGVPEIVDATTTTDGISFVRHGAILALDGTNTNASHIRFRLYGEEYVKRGGTPANTANTIANSVQLYAGRRYWVVCRLVSGTYTPASSNGFGVSAFVGVEEGTEEAASFIPSTQIVPATASAESKVYISEIKPSENTYVCLWFLLRSGDVFANAVFESQLLDVTDAQSRDTSIAPVDAHTAQNAHASGSLLMNGGQLYKATSDIASGDTLLPGTNVSETTIADQFAERDSESSPDFLYKAIFGDDSDWSVDHPQYNGDFPTIKTGRLFTIKGNGNSNTSVVTVNLTGTTHSSRPGNWEDGNSAVYDTDFIAIPDILKPSHEQRVGLKMHWNILQMNVNTNNGFSLGVLLRRMNEDTQEYEYGNRTILTGGFSLNNADQLTSCWDVVLRTDGIGEVLKEIPWDDYTEVAIYLIRRNRVMRGTLVIEPYCGSNMDSNAFDGLMSGIGLVDYGYRQSYRIDPSDTSSFHMSRNGVYVTFNASTSGKRWCRLTGAPARVTAASSTAGWTTGVSLKSGHLYMLTSRLVSGTVTASGDYPIVTPIVTGTSSMPVTASSGQQLAPNFYWRVFRAGDTPINITFIIYANTSFENAVYEVLLKDITEEGQDVAGTDPVITALPGHHYNCTNAYVNSLTFTPCEVGVSSVRFTAGSNMVPPVLPNTVKMPDWWSSSSIVAGRTYEISVRDGVYGVVASWA